LSTSEGDKNFSGVREDRVEGSVEKKVGRRNGRQKTTEG
jgi:hypothetical protein